MSKLHAIPLVAVLVLTTLNSARRVSGQTAPAPNPDRATSGNSDPVRGISGQNQLAANSSPARAIVATQGVEQSGFAIMANYNRARYGSNVDETGQNLDEVGRPQVVQYVQVAQPVQSAAVSTSGPNATTVESFSDLARHERFHQVMLQHKQYGAFNGHRVQRQLNLTEAQRQKFRELDQEWNRQMKTMHAESDSGSPSVEAKFERARQSVQQNIQAHLTPEQWDQWKSLTGKPFDFTADFYFPNAPVTTTVAKPTLP